METAAAAMSLTDLRPQPADILADVLDGLARTPKQLPSKYFYDAHGSSLFEAITQLPEYYLTRTELALLEQRMPDIAAAVGANAHVVEYGSGSGRKTELLLQGLQQPVAYTPVEISRSVLLASTQRMAGELPAVEMLPVCADFTQAIALPPPSRSARRTLMFFPGSTLGNFTRPHAVAILRAMHQTMGNDGRALIGIDLDKDPALIDAAYNDSAGVTARFTLNLLARLNREIGSNFNLDQFQHRASYVRERGRIETFLVSLIDQDVRVGGQLFHFDRDEAMQVEYSHKYTDPGFSALAAEAGLEVAQHWNDARDWFGLRLLRPIAPGQRLEAAG
ncbi:L-histidine N(alpha)-methyltransferase [Pseudoxanthomonas dokdonensis]|uniref:L-histidine N(alpha)-methyltransferase n=1 Tax=Pseudoxanthomonas dokdonensis TaxID=344882 RepID=UPI003CCB84D0